MCDETKKALLNAGKLLAFAFALGVAFQMGVGLTSIATPTVKKIEIHTTHQGAAPPVG